MEVSCNADFWGLIAQYIAVTEMCNRKNMTSPGFMPGDYDVCPELRLKDHIRCLCTIDQLLAAYFLELSSQKKSL